jgi:hypothetical protein
MPLYPSKPSTNKLHQKEKPMDYVQLPRYVHPIQDHYTVYVISVASYRTYYLSNYNLVAKALNLKSDTVEDLFDWIINEALTRILRVLNSGQVTGHHSHDLYKCAYDHIGIYAEMALSKHIQLHGLRFLDGETVKALVAGDNLIIAKGTVSYA